MTTNECCEWHAVKLNDNLQDEPVISYCPECLSINKCIHDSVVRVSGSEYAFYYEKHKLLISATR